MLSPKRQGRITASSVAGILNLSPWETRDDVMRRMVRDYHGAESEWQTNPAVEYGNRHEKDAVEMFKFECEKPVTKVLDEQEFVIHPEHDWLGATPDGLVGDRDILEVKCPFSLRKGGEFKHFEDQMHYWHQIQVQLACTQREACWFVQFSPVLGIDIYVTYRKDDYDLTPLYDFYAEYLHERERDFQRHIEPKRKQVETIAAKALLDQYDDLVDQEDGIKQRKAEIIEQLAEIAGGRDAEIHGRKFTHVVRKGSVNYSKLVKDMLPDVDVEPYRGKESEYWRLT